jgi:uncharacterized membrane protein YdbT with pleckstrin-like domain
MPASEIPIQRDRLVRYREIQLLIVGIYVIGRLLLELGLSKAIRDWAASLTYRLNDSALFVSSCFALWGIVLYRTEKTIPLAKITDVRLVQGPILGKMNLWILQIQTASAGGTDYAEATLYAPESPHELREQIVRAINKNANEK